MHRMLLPDPIFRQFEQMANGIRRLLGEKRWSDAECVSQLLGELQARRKADFLRASGAAAPVAGGSTVPVDGDGRSRTIPAEIRRAALVRARFVCEFCKNRYGAEIHHVIPFCKGGTHELHNLIVLCSRCHQKLHDEERRDAGTTDAPCGADGTDAGTDHEARDPMPARGTRSPAAPPVSPASAPSPGRGRHADAPAEERAGAGHGRAGGSAAGQPVGPPSRGGAHLFASEVRTRPPGNAIPPGEPGKSAGARPPGAKDRAPSEARPPDRGGRAGDTSS
jgi:hypothetical protein